MFIFRLGSTCTFEYKEPMPPRKRRRTADTGSSETKSEVKDEPSTSVDSDPDYGENWRDQCLTACSKYDYALKKNILSDVEFEVGPTKARIQGHRLILALGSPVFEAMFFGALPEKGDTISIPDVDPEGFRNLLKFLYSDSVIFQNDAVAFKTYFAADKYCITGLKQHCENFLCNTQLTDANVWAYLESSLFLNSVQLRERCSRFLSYSIDASVMHENFLEVNGKTVEALLCIERLDVPEEKLLRRIIEWAEHQQQNSENSVWDSLRPLLKHMRLGALTGDEFVDLRQNTKFGELLNEGEALAILEYIASPMKAPLPEWCSGRTTNRREDLVASKRTHVARLEEVMQNIRKKPKKPKYLLQDSSDTSSTSSSDTSSMMSDSSSSDSDL